MTNRLLADEFVGLQFDRAKSVRTGNLRFPVLATAEVRDAECRMQDAGCGMHGNQSTCLQAILSTAFETISYTKGMSNK